MPDSSSTITNMQKLIKQLQKNSLNQIQEANSEPLGRIHQIMRENSLTPDMVQLSFKQRKTRTPKQPSEAKTKSTADTAAKTPVMQK